MMDAQRQRQIEKFRGEKCCVCGKWGAAEILSEPVAALKALARAERFTIRDPQSNNAHRKCVGKLKEMIRNQRTNRFA